MSKLSSKSKPLLKWVGGKTQIIDDIIGSFPKEINDYHEPVVGGGSVLVALLTNVKNGKIKLSGKIYASDLNSYLISFYKKAIEMLSRSGVRSIFLASMFVSTHRNILTRHFAPWFMSQKPLDYN